MMTAPIGTSSLTDAALASLRAACIPVRSLGDGVPLRTCHLRHGRAPREPEMVARALDADRVALPEIALQDFEGDRVLQLPLNDPLERTGAVDRVVSLEG